MFCEEKKSKVISEAVEKILLELGYDLSNEHLIKTPQRMAEMLWYLVHGKKIENEEKLQALFNLDENNESCDVYSGMVILRNCEFYSLCAHHVLPFYGSVSLGYIPSSKIIGVSKLARIVEYASAGLNVQEVMTERIANMIDELVKPKGVMVVVKGVHLCMRMRGVETQHSEMITSKVVGVYAKDINARQEFLNLIRGGSFK